ncbi:MAG: hemerythrin domain-containing protein [Acidobacteria bacterium]|nr:hemerythrin domain-containing protein [Acidobacteriota bacterium]
MLPFIPRPDLDVIDLLLGEHGCLLSLFRHIEMRLPNLPLADVLSAGETLESLLMAHAVEEDQLLFNALPAEQTGVKEALAAMAGEHNEQRRMLEELREETEVVLARGRLLRLIELTREHFAVEERILFGLAKQVLDDERRSALGREFARRRGLSQAH